jgi:nucleotide-binding universal stress UspA family protein
MFTKILVAVHANSPDTVLASAIETAQKYDAQIVALHIVDVTPCYIGAADCNFGLIVEAMETHGREVVTQVRNTLDVFAGNPFEVRMVTIVGMTVGRAIADVADETGADLILLGERNSAWWRWMDEDVASEVMRCSTRPTQIVSDRSAVSLARRGGTRWTDASAARF